MNDLATYLAAVQDLYPGGIPLALLRGGASVAKCQGCGRECRGGLSLAGGSPKGGSLCFVAAHPDRAVPSESEIELLRAAVGKGLQRDIGSAVLFDLFSCAPDSCTQSATLENLVSLAHTRLSALQPEKIIILGTTAAEILKVASSQPESKVETWNGIPAITTHSVLDVIRDQGCKKRFWTDLKALAAG
jgi:hypothetical protein